MSDGGILTWQVDALYAVHGDMRGHTDSMMSAGSGCAYSTLNKQKLVS